MKSPNQPTLRELLRPIVAHRLMLLSVVVLAVAASIVYSATKRPVYQASASISYQDESYDLGLVGLTAPATQTSVQLAAAGAQTILQQSVARRVKQDLHSPLSTSALLGSVAATVEPSSNLVVIEASGSSASEAQKLANAFATRGADATNAQVRALYGAAYTEARKHLSRKGGPKPDAASLALESEQLSRLQVLSSIASAAQVVRPATLPSAPSSPKPVRDALLAAVLGVVLGLLAVYVRDSFDRRLRSVSDVEEQFPLPLLGHVRSEVLGQSPRAGSPGTNGHAPVAAADWELFRILRRNLDFLEPGRDVRTLAVTSSLPEEGKSTVAAFLAFASAAAGKRTLLIECDLRRPVLAERLGLERSPGLSDFVVGSAKPEEILQVVGFGNPVTSNGHGPVATGAANGAANPAANGAANGATGAAAGEKAAGGAVAGGVTSGPGGAAHMHELVCISAGARTDHPVEILRSEAFATMLQQVREAYDLVILDTPPLLSAADTLELLPHVDGAVVCVRVFKTTRQQASAGRAALRRLPERPTGLVVTGTQRTSEAEYGYYGYYS